MDVNEKKIKLKKKLIRHFNFGSKSKCFGIISLNIKYSNLFLTFSDINNRIIYNISGGRIIKGNKRIKKTNSILEKMISILVPYLKICNIDFIKVIFYNPIQRLSFLLLRELAYHNFCVRYIELAIPYAHNGMRGKKLRRV